MLEINSTLSEKLCVISYNSRGFSIEKRQFCTFLISEAFAGNSLPILCNQENFVLRGNSYIFNQTFPDFYTLPKPAVKETMERGRPKGGLFISVPHVLKDFISDISPSHWRIQAAILTTSFAKILIINSYFPVDPRNGDTDELIETLEVIKRLVVNHNYDELLLTGVLNADFIRNTRHCSLFKIFNLYIRGKDLM